jgi:hypothetical protein
VALLTSIEDLEPSVFLVSKIGRRPSFSDWWVLLIALVIGLVADLRGWPFGGKRC